MKKILDSKFLFILALSIVVLIILGVGAFYLFDDKDDVFVKDGYILNPLSAKNEKYLFDKDTPYKENLSSMVVFTDTDNNEVSVFKDSFLHYMDSSLSFLKNGAILDLGSISGTDAVKFYNITNKSIISKSSDGYVIETNGEDINLKNFMGRISDKKYIVAGSLEAKIPGNEKNITGNYFEIVYNDEGVITIENNEVKYQVAAQGSYIYASDVVIDLGDKKITKAGEDVMSITAITINGDENIEIIPKAKEQEENNGTENNSGTGEDGTGDGTGGDGTGNTTANNDAREDIKIEDLLVSLKDYEIYSTKITVVFDIINQREDDSLILKITDLDSGKTVDRVYDVLENQEIRVSKLSPDTKYLFTVINERDGNKYFQKILKTKDFGIKLEQSYVTSNEIGYKVIIDENSEIDDIDITLMKFDEQKKDYNFDEAMTYHLSDIDETIEGEHDGIIFSGLDSDTIYTVTLDGFVINAIKTEKIYNITMTSLTLKEAPTFGAMNKEVNDDGFKLFIENVNDKDNAIQSYTYYIFDNQNDTNPNDFEFQPDDALTKIVRTTAEPVELKIGQNGIETNHNYLYMLSIEYYDNEKYVEYVIDGRIDLFIGNDPYVTIQKGDDIGYDYISAVITITDNSCLIAMEDRTCYDDYENNPVIIDVKERDGKGNLIKVDGYPLNVSDFAVNGNILRKNLKVTGLKEGTTYVLSVSAMRKDKPEDGIRPIKAGAIYENEIETKYLSSFNVTWSEGASSDREPINGTFKLSENKNEYTIPGDKAAEIIERVVFKLYDGVFSNSLAQPTLLATSDDFVNTDEISLKDMFYDNEFPITESVFGIEDIDALRALTREKTGKQDNKLSAFYTVMAEVYYENDSKAVLYPPQHPFSVAAYLTSDVEMPNLTAEEIWKSSTDNFNSALTIGEGGAVVGYNIHVIYDKVGYEVARLTIENINMYVYDGDRQVSFYIDDNGNSASVIKTLGEDLTDDNFDVSLFMADGVENGTSSEFMTRGKEYSVRVEINYKTVDGNTETQISNPIKVLAKKESPAISGLYVAETTKDGDVTYKYKIVDVDNAWYKEENEYNIYYRIADGEEHKITIVKGSDEFNSFKISGLVSGNGYTLSYKRNDYDTGGSNDVSTVIIGEENRLFEGYFDANDERYNFKYRVINDPLHDNKVTIEILASDDILDKILIYKVKFTDIKGNVYEVPHDVYSLNKCDWAEASDKNRCFQVEYKKLKDNGMKSEGEEKNYITVSIEAIYDNGLMGYDYIDKFGPDKEYPYMIMQDDSTVEKIGNYFIVNNKSLFDLSGNGSRLMPLGYYYFSFKYGGIEYKSQYKIGDNFQITYTLDNRGYYVNGAGSLNPKMVSTKVMTGIDNEFYFSSITPLIHEDKVISLINGAKVMLTLSGAENEDFCAHNNQSTCAINGDKFLYIQVLDEDTLEVANGDTYISEPIRPTVKVKLNNSDINGQYVTGDNIEDYDSILGLSHDQTYYYRVFAYLNDGGMKKLTQIFDSTSKNKPVTYTFDTKKLSGVDGVLAGRRVDYRANPEGEYNDKELVMSIDLNPYDTEMAVPYMFDVTYEFCKEIDCETEDSRLFEKTIPQTTQNMISYENIPTNNFEFGRNYYVYLYMTYDYYDNTIGELVKRTVSVYDEEDAVVNMPQLTKPSFVVSRWADYVADVGGNTINLKVTVYDDDQVLTNSNFYVKLFKSNDETKTVQGKLMLENDEGIFTQVMDVGEYESYAFVADDGSENNYQNKTIRIGGLEADTKYTLVVYGNAHINNHSAEIKDIIIFSGKDATGDQIWSSNDYGVAFGKDITYRATENGFIVRYPGGSNLDELHINAVEVDVKDYNGKPFYNKTITIGENNTYFTGNDIDGKYRFVIEYDEAGKKNERDETYLIVTRYHVYNPATSEIVILDETYNASFEQNVTYDPDQVIDDE